MHVCRSDWGIQVDLKCTCATPLGHMQTTDLWYEFLCECWETWSFSLNYRVRNKKSYRADSVSLFPPVELSCSGIHSQTLPLSLPHSIDSVDNLDSPEKSLSSWPQTLCLSAHAYNIVLQPRGCFFPLLLLLFLFLPQFCEILSQHVCEKKGFVGRDWQRLPKSTPLLSLGRPSANWTLAGFVPLGHAWGGRLPAPGPHGVTREASVHFCLKKKAAH